jgi:hypothetical protein
LAETWLGVLAGAALNWAVAIFSSKSGHSCSFATPKSRAHALTQRLEQLVVESENEIDIDGGNGGRRGAVHRLRRVRSGFLE